MAFDIANLGLTLAEAKLLLVQVQQAVVAAQAQYQATFGPTVSQARGSAISPDVDDTKLLQCAQADRADVFITGNKRDFPAATYGPMVVLRITEFL